ncbi:MAG: hypothetical protein ACLP4W_31195 [Mycobacterium sp.]|uniref:DUF5666 domain-containing protein n=1 Tax=Mycobacterium sp. TaxID=1785 RepID=UPI003F965281
MISANSHMPRLARFAVLAVTGAAALSIAACGSSNQSSPTSSPSSSASPTGTPNTTTSAPANGQAHVSGLIASVSGNMIQVTQDTGTATVDFTGSTKVSEVTAASLTDVTTGSCVTVRPSHEGSQGGQPVTAANVRVSPAVDGKCPQAKESVPGSGPGSTTPAPSPTTAPAKRSAVQGAVTSVAGNTINVTSTDTSGNTSQTAVAVNDKTRYTKQASATSQAITAGKCIAARGTTENGGTLQATTATLRPANDGKCGGPGKQPHG